MTLELVQRDVARAKDYFINKVAFSVGPIEINQQIEQGALFALIDVREEADFEKGHLPGAINVPEAQWKTPVGLRKNAINVLYCYSQTCHLAARAAVEFATKGYPVVEMEGGFEAWEKNNLKIETRRSQSQ